MGILIIAVLIMASYSTVIKGKLSVGAILLLVLCGVSNGIYDFSLKLYTHFSSSSISVLNLITYIISMAGMILVFIIPSKKDPFDVKKCSGSQFGRWLSCRYVCLLILTLKRCQIITFPQRRFIQSIRQGDLY